MQNESVLSPSGRALNGVAFMYMPYLIDLYSWVPIRFQSERLANVNVYCTFSYYQTNLNNINFSLPHISCCLLQLRAQGEIIDQSLILIMDYI